MSVSFVYKWAGPDNLVISGETNGTLIISRVDFDDAGQYMCIIIASYTGSKVNTTYVMDSVNTASAYLTVKSKLVEIIYINTI